MNRFRYTVGGVLSHLDSDFDIPDEGVSSDVEWLVDGDFEKPDLILPSDSVVVPDEDED